MTERDELDDLLDSYEQRRTEAEQALHREREEQFEFEGQFVVWRNDVARPVLESLATRFAERLQSDVVQGAESIGLSFMVDDEPQRIDFECDAENRVVKIGWSGDAGKSGAQSDEFKTFEVLTAERVEAYARERIKSALMAS
jgi:hypothetical protein